MGEIGVQLGQALIAIALGVGGAVLYFWGSSKLLDMIFPFRDGTGPEAVRNQNITAMVRPWLFLGPALISLTVFLIYPFIYSVWLSFHDRTGETFIGFENYSWLANDGEFRESLWNNFWWLVFAPAMSTFLGLVAAALTDRIWWGNIAKSLIFMPMAISFVGASVIWKFVYDYRAEGEAQIGILNAIVTFFGGSPQAWLTLTPDSLSWIQWPGANDFMLMVVLIWTQTGFAMVLLSAALRGIPEETIEAAVIDGANGLQIFFKIMVPQIWGTIAVVWTTITIMVLKIFDVVLAMTNGQWGTQVLANMMFDWMFRGGGDSGKGSAIAIVIMIAVIPIMVWNIKRANAEMKGR